MPNYDMIVLPDDLALPEFPSSPKYRDEDSIRKWQTKDLASTLDVYRVHPETKLLERRVPSIIEFIEEGVEYRDEHLIEDAENWRYGRFTGNLTIKDETNKKLYEYELQFEHGRYTDASLEDKHDLSDFNHVR